MDDSKSNEKFSIGSLPSFLSGCRDELGKVSKPTKQETIKATLVTLFIVVFMSCALALMDVLFNAMMRSVL